ncbi:hypothetical protein LMANV2_280027 [Leptospira interrogans serovar Manilae]|uniref:Uncharacterized protein n=1 Tax=Leptospira interrogans serovar Manilae TaxID=214675 RepID=A0AAQ1P0D4_LEPIR|nr:hypothetical protein LMANV2_280027 [Leptospira interrogans serovar Manilae]
MGSVESGVFRAACIIFYSAFQSLILLYQKYKLQGSVQPLHAKAGQVLMNKSKARYRL